MQLASLCRTLVALSAFTAAPILAQQTDAKAADPADPLIGAYLDTAAARLALSTRPPIADTRRAARILTVSFDTLGQVSDVRAPVEEAMPLPERDALIAIVRANVRTIAPRPRGWTTHLLVTPGGDARIEETHLAVMEPAVSDRITLTRRLERETQRLMRADETLGAATLTVRLRMRIRADGTVESHTVTLSSGRPAVDEAAVRILTRTLFTPAVAEGVAVPWWVIQPIRFVFPDGQLQ
jgi:TonB family protein